MVKDQSERILSLSRQIRDLSAELDRVLTLQASCASSPSSIPSPAPVPSAPVASTHTDPAPTSYRSFRVGDIVRITNRFGGFRNRLASIIEDSAPQSFELKLLDSGETLSKRKWNVEFVRRPRR